MKWPHDGDSQQLSNFETMARKLRYRALGRACLEDNIQSLLVAHHKDDQAETVMMRIAQGHRGAGLKGMLPVSDIPECWAIHGVHQSGAREAAEKRTEIIKARKGPRYGNSKPSQPDVEGEQSPPLSIEDGGIKIYRPFLGFDKERLKVTCQASQVAWVEDETNQNPALTPRNAVRQLLRLGRLPEAIQKASLSALAIRVQKTNLARKTRAEGYFRLCVLDTRVGAAIVRLRLKSADRGFVPAIHLHQSLLNKEYQYALVVRRMMEMVSPAPVISLEDLHSAVQILFPERIDPASREQKCKLTCGGVNFERVRSDAQKIRSSSFDPDFVWILTRQPFASATPSPSLTFSTLTNPKEGSSSSSSSSRTFSLWDGRFWFRVTNPHSKPVVIRPFYPADLTLLRATMPKERTKHLDKLLQLVAPGKTRWTLPVLAEAEAEAENNHNHDTETPPNKSKPLTLNPNQKAQAQALAQAPPPSLKKAIERTGGPVLALPTLSWDCGARERGIGWEARYKKVRLPTHKNFTSVIL